MRKLTTFLAGVLLIISCQKNSNTAPEEALSPEEKPLKRSCAADEVLQQQLASEPGLRDQMEAIEAFTRRAISSGAAAKVTAGGVIEVPVVVHVLYNKAQENIPDAQIQSQIDVLNEDFNLRNADNTNVPSLFTSVKANVGVHYTLARTIRKQTSKKSWQANDGMKYTSKGGDDAVDPAHYLNLWVCNLAGGLLGYAQFPGGKAATDGVVIGYFCFGRTGTALIAPYDKGRTATHEVGHWMNLRHIWGDTNCGDDLVGDTPKHTTANYGCPDYPHYNSCTDHAVEMTMDYMDYTDDPCMYMFSNGQKSRMLAVFAAGGPRASFVK
ncbi:MAG TPA: zinc metalloprotease [Flavisolibacter sp.]|jgi:hypothetical protein|nr:zinc metalloprotease [Flavisolibacter sp.]